MYVFVYGVLGGVHTQTLSLLSLSLSLFCLCSLWYGTKSVAMEEEDQWADCICCSRVQAEQWATGKSQKTLSLPLHLSCTSNLLSIPSLSNLFPLINNCSNLIQFNDNWSNLIWWTTHTANGIQLTLTLIFQCQLTILRQCCTIN